MKDSLTMPNAQASAWLAWARYYVTQGFLVLPLEPLGKRPATPNGYKDATNDDAQLARWAASCPNANLGIVPPDGVVVVDVDPRNGGTLEGLPVTRAQRTGGGGVHALYTAPAGLRWSAKVRDGVDLKTTNGFIVAAPSVVKQPDGRLGTYRWENPSDPVAPAPEFVLRCGRPPGVDQRRPRLEHEIDEDAIARVVAALVPLCVPGQRHELAKRLGSYLGGRGWSLAAVEAVCAALPFEDVAARTTAAVECASHPGGVSWLREQLGGPAFDVLDQTIPNPRVEQQLAMVKPLSDHVESIKEQWQSREAARMPQPAKVVDPSDPWFGFGPPKDLAATPEPIEPVIEGLDVARGHCTGLVAHANGGKTPLLAQALLCVANGLPFLGKPTRATRCALFVFEKFRGVNSRVRSVAKKLGVSPASVDVFEVRSESLNDPGVVERLHAMITARGYGLIGVDTYNSATGPGVERNSAQFSEALRLLTAIPAPVAWLINFHTNKNGDGTDLRHIDGHNSIAGALDACWGLVRTSERNKDEYELWSVRELHEPFAPVRIRVATAEPQGPLDALEPARCYVVDGEAESVGHRIRPMQAERKPTRAEQPTRPAWQSRRSCRNGTRYRPTNKSTVSPPTSGNGVSKASRVGSRRRAIW